MRRFGASRGVAMAETAISLAFTLLLIYFGLELALAGFLQLQVDGATFVASHAYANGSSTAAINGSATFHGAFPKVTAGLNPSTHQPPDTQVSNVNHLQWSANGLTQRYGGLSLLRPSRIVTTTSVTLKGLLGQPVSLTGVDFEGQPVVVTHDMDAQGTGYNTNSAYSVLWNPLTQDDQNTPPYYFAMSYMWYCNDPMPGGYNPDGSGWWQSCPSGDRELHALGLAESLQHDNYNAVQNGIQSGGTFANMLCHQQIFAAISQDLQSYDMRNKYLNDMKQGADVSTKMATISTWDVYPLHGESMSNAGQLYPLHPGNGCS